MGTEFADDYINENEDVIMTVSLFQTAESYYTMKEIGYYNSYDEKNNGFPKTKIGKCKESNKIKKFGLFKVLKFLVDKYSIDDKEKNIAFNFIKGVDVQNRLQMPLDNRHYQILFHIYDKILEWKCLNNEQREIILNKKNIVIKRKNNPNYQNYSSF